VVFEKNLSLLIFASGETASNERLLFLGGHGGTFLFAGADGLGLFLRGLLLVGFRGFVAHNFIFSLRLTRLRHGIFSEGNRRVLDRAFIVNGSRKLSMATLVLSSASPARVRHGFFTK